MKGKTIFKAIWFNLIYGGMVVNSLFICGVFLRIALYDEITISEPIKAVLYTELVISGIIAISSIWAWRKGIDTVIKGVIEDEENGRGRNNEITLKEIFDEIDREGDTNSGKRIRNAKRYLQGSSRNTPDPIKNN